MNHHKKYLFKKNKKEFQVSAPIKIVIVRNNIVLIYLCYKNSKKKLIFDILFVLHLKLKSKFDSMQSLLRINVRKNEILSFF